MSPAHIHPSSRVVTGRALVLIAVTVFGIVASLVVARGLRMREHRAFEAEFEHRAQERALAIQGKLQSYVEHVESIGAVRAVAGPFDRESFRTFTAPVLRDHPGIQALGWDPVIPRDRRAAHESELQREGSPDYVITERTADGRLVPASERDQYVVVTLVEPLAGNEAALGYDIYSEPVRREALVRARETGRPAITGRVHLVQDTADQFGTLICVPVFDAAHPESIERRREDLLGYAVGVLRIGDVVNLALTGLRPTGIHLRITDDSAPEGERLLHRHVSRTAGVDPDDSSRENQRSFEFPIGGRRWSIHATPTAGYLASHDGWTPAIVIAIGLFSTALLVGYIRWQGVVNRRLQHAIFERDRAEERQASFGRMLDESHDEIYVCDADSLRFLHVNRGARENLGFSMTELREMTPADLTPGMTEQSFSEQLKPLREGVQNRTESTTVHRRKDGSLYDVEVHLQLSTFGPRQTFVAVAMDCTERNLFEERYRQSQRIEALGTLAGGIAHDFNNILAAIMGHTELSLADETLGTTVRKRLREVLKASERARDVVRQILTFSRRTRIERRPIRLGELVREALQLMRASLPTTVTIHEDISDDAETAGDSTQIHQVLMNLCTNAAHAMRGRGGLLEIQQDSVELEAAEATRIGDLKPGSYARISVRDSGHGIPAEIRDRIFDPFFTTKGPGEGSGMGLAVAHGIVRSHGGALRVASQPGRGSQFEVYLPRIGISHVEVVAPQRTEPRREASILVVDDEPAITELLQTMLERVGYIVQTRTDSIEALETFRARPDEFDLIITDHTMPKMTGIKLARECRRIAPGVSVILVSGYGDLLDKSEIEDSGVRELLTKPLRSNELTAAVHRALDETSTRVF